MDPLNWKLTILALSMTQHTRKISHTRNTASQYIRSLEFNESIHLLGQQINLFNQRGRYILTILLSTLWRICCPILSASRESANTTRADDGVKSLAF